MITSHNALPTICNLASGYIFVQVNEGSPFEHGYVNYLGGVGYIGRLDSTHHNGFEQITYDEYIQDLAQV